MLIKKLLFIILFYAPFVAYCHNGVITGVVKDPATNLPLEGASVQLHGSTKKATFTDKFGLYKFSSLNEGKYIITISFIGFERITLDAEVKNDETTSLNPILLKTTNLQLSEVTINAPSFRPDFNSLKSLDIKLRPFQSSQELLRMVPGLFIAQHAGGGKAEQLFLRGFDLDHGTDINITVDGMPVNMVSHAHGQGYSDLHFLIPELVENIDFGKGPYYSSKGNFTTAGYVGFNTFKTIQNSVKIEGGRFGTFRNVNRFNVLGKKTREKGHDAYIASEALLSKGYFESPQNLRRFNLFGKYNGYLSDNTLLTVSLSNFYSKWDASGQVPDRAVQSGIISRYGSLDDTEGGNTGRKNVNISLTNSLPFGSVTNQVYFIKYDFDLYSNFTFFLNDSINGDQIRQRERRNIYGYQGTFLRESELFGKKLVTNTGIGIRMDDVKGIELSSAVRREFLAHKTLGNLREINSNAFVESTINLSDGFSINSGVRIDNFVFNYRDKINAGDQQVTKTIVSPKLNFNYKVSDDFNVYFKTGTGFHSNDTRVVVQKSMENILPRAYGVDLGTTLKPFKNLILNTALWFLYLENELVYVGDEGVVEPSRETRRIGVDLSARYQLSRQLFADFDINYSNPKSFSEEGQEYIPLAPTLTTTGGLSLKSKKGIDASVRYRYMADRSANEDYSVTAQGYLLIDALVKYTVANIEFSLSAENLLNQEWNEAQFDTESRLKGESQPVSEIHYTPGAPLFVKAGINILIK